MQSREYFFKYLDDESYASHLRMLWAVRKRYVDGQLLQMPDNWRQIDYYKDILLGGVSSAEARILQREHQTDREIMDTIEGEHVGEMERDIRHYSDMPKPVKDSDGEFDTKTKKNKNTDMVIVRRSDESQNPSKTRLI